MSNTELQSISEEQLVSIMRIVEPAFDVVRIVDPSTFEARTLDKDGTWLSRPEICYHALESNRRCANCVSARTIAERMSTSKYDIVGGSISLVTTRYLNVGGKPYSLELISFAQDQIEQFDERVSELANQIRETGNKRYIDEETGAFRREYFSEGLHGLMGFCLAIARIEHFDAIVARHGEECGKAALRAFAELALEVLRAEDTLIRYDADEFIIQFDESDDRFYEELEEIRTRIKDVRLADYPDVRISVCIGAIEEPLLFSELATRAEKLLDVAGEAGDRVILYSNTARFDEASFSAESVEAAPSSMSEIASRPASLELDEAMLVHPVTGLTRIAGFTPRVQNVMDGPHGADGTYCLVHFDIENFKGYNRAFGFNDGDKLLRFFGEALSAQFGDDNVAHVSIDHFVVLSTCADAEARINTVGNVVREMQRSSIYNIKAGIFVLDGSAREAGVACDNAKSACDSIKGTYDTSFCYYDAALDRKLHITNHVIEHFEDALSQKWIKVFYQPLVHASTGEVYALEALARWDDPQLGLLSPVDVIPVLEHMRLIDKLDAFMVESVCAQLASLLDEGRPVLPVSVNLSKLDFELCDMLEKTISIVDAYKIPHELVHIELTESTFEGDPELFRPTIDKFRDAGFQVWMDDFGSGYSSLNSLKDYCVDVVKLDMAFLRGFTRENKRSLEILRSIVSMVHALSMTTVCEGVETAEQYEFLREIGCSVLQGYYFGKPRPVESLPPA